MSRVIFRISPASTDVMSSVILLFMSSVARLPASKHEWRE